MTKEQKNILDDFKVFHTGNNTKNHREIQAGAQRRAISDIKKMSLLGHPSKGRRPKTLYILIIFLQSSVHLLRQLFFRVL